MKTDFVFGVPYYKGWIDPSKFNKQEIVETIAKNYQIDKTRNIWDSHLLSNSNMHHAYADWNNDKFHQVDFSLLSPLYENHIRTFLDSFGVKHYRYEFKLVNYTCYGKGQFMLEHDHLLCDFSAVHYLKYNRLLHPPTVYTNPLVWNNYISSLISKRLVNDCDITIENSWLMNTFQLGAKEDDIIIVPGVLRHSVPQSKSEELRMALVINITMLE